MTIYFISLITIPHVLMGMSASSFLGAQSRREREETMAIIVSSLGDQVLSFLGETRSALKMLGHILDTNDLPSRSTSGDAAKSAWPGETLSSFLAEYPMFESVYLLDRDGRSVAVAPIDDDYLGVDLSRQKFFSRGSAEGGWSPTFVSLRSGRPTLGLTISIGKGSLVGTLDLERLGVLVSPVGLGEEGGAFILDAAGTIIGARDAALTLERQSFPKDCIPAPKTEGAAVFFDYQFEKRSYAATALRLPGVGWIAVVYRPLDELRAPLWNSLVGIGISFVFSLGVALLLSLRSRELMLHPLESLASAAERFSAGDYSAGELAPTGILELDGLGAAFGAAGVAIAARELATRVKDSELRASLAEKEGLLREIHHRVKNNLQIISSILNLQSATLCYDDPVEPFRECQNRVQAMAAVHERLYLSADLSRIDMSEYLDNVASGVFDAYGGVRERVTLYLKAGDQCLDIDHALPIGLIVTEALSNACKHGFPSPIRGHVNVTFRAEPEEAYLLSITNDGLPPPPGYRQREARSLGLQLIEALSAQIKGAVVFGAGPEGKGFFLEVRFRLFDDSPT